MFKAAGLRKVIWYCCKLCEPTYFVLVIFYPLGRRECLNVIAASSRGRGPRAAGWFSDYIVDSGDEVMESLILVGGIKGWATAGGEFLEWMDGYDTAAWSNK